MSNSKGFFQRLTSWSSTLSLIAISGLVTLGMNALPNPAISQMAVPTFFILTAAFLGIHFLGRLAFGDKKKEADAFADVQPNKEAFESAKNPVEWLKKCDSRRLFVNEIEVISQTYDRIMLREHFFSKYEADSPFTKSYGLIQTQVLSDIKSCGQFIGTYHPSSTTSKTYLYDLMKNSRSLADKLDQLVEEAIATQSVADDVDTGYVDDLLQSLDDLKARQV